MWFFLPLVGEIHVSAERSGGTRFMAFLSMQRRFALGRKGEKLLSSESGISERA
jgi:hypothetical protein